MSDRRKPYQKTIERTFHIAFKLQVWLVAECRFFTDPWVFLNRVTIRLGLIIVMERMAWFPFFDQKNIDFSTLFIIFLLYSLIFTTIYIYFYYLFRPEKVGFSLDVFLFFELKNVVFHYG